MKNCFDRDDLLHPLQSLMGVVDRQQSMPILGHVLIDGLASSVTLVATDTEVELSIQLPHPTEESGAFTLPGRMLYEICRSLPEDASVELSVSEGQATVRSGRSRFSLMSFAAPDFPRIGMCPERARLTVASGDLKTLLEETHVAMAVQDVRYYLNGMLLERHAGGLRGVATDGHRLAIRDIYLPQEGQDPVQIIVPRKAVIELLRVLPGGSDEVQLMIGETHLQVRVGGLILTSKLVDGRYPDYDRVIPKDCERVVIAPREVLRDSLKRACIVCTDRYKAVRIALGKGVLSATAQNADREHAEEDIEVDYDGGSVEIGFNGSYLLDALDVIKSERVRIELKDAGSGCILVPEEGRNPTLVVMPMRL
jgi:DNA polymerase III subunit beta